jgi:hypothetical protein
LKRNWAFSSDDNGIPNGAILTEIDTLAIPIYLTLLLNFCGLFGKILSVLYTACYVGHLRTRNYILLNKIYLYRIYL